MRPHTVISAFKSGGQLVSPPGIWTPPNEKAAERLTAAKCIRPATDNEIKRLARLQDHDDDLTQAGVSTMEQVTGAGYTEEAAIGIIQRAKALVTSIASGTPPAEAEAKAEAEVKAEADEPGAGGTDTAAAPAEEPEPEPEPEAGPKSKPKRGKKGRK